MYEGLEADNSESEWLAHRTVYEAQIKAPLEALLAVLAPEFGEAAAGGLPILLTSNRLRAPFWRWLQPR